MSRILERSMLDDRSNLNYDGVMASGNTEDRTDVRENIIAVGQRVMASKGFSAVGINEILAEAGVPKGSFYHYFGSKDAFGVAMLSSYFDYYLAEMDKTLGRSGSNMAKRLVLYFSDWKRTQSVQDCQGKCLAVKLGAEVADLSEPMREAMKQGTSGIISRLQAAIEAGQVDRSLDFSGSSGEMAESLYQLWVGASVLAKIGRSTRPFGVALETTRRILQIPG